MTLLCLLASAWGAGPAEYTADESGRTARWNEVVDHLGPVAVQGRSGRWVPRSGGGALRLECEHEPVVRSLVRGVMVRSHGGVRAIADGAWIVPAALSSTSLSGWFVHPSACKIQRLSTSAGPWAHALAETDGASLHVADTRLAAWIGRDPLRRAAVRPGGPHPVGRRDLVVGRGAAHLAHQVWRHADVGDVRRVRGPARVVLSLRALGRTDEVCALIDGRRRCQESSPSRVVEQRAGGLSTHLRELPDGTPVHRRATFFIGLGPGEHSVSAAQPSLARATYERAETWSRASIPSGVAVWTTPAPPEWITAPADGGERLWLVGLAPRPQLSSAAHWAPLRSVDDSVAAAEDGLIELWLEPEDPSVVCTVQLGSMRAAALAPRGIHRMRWAGPEATPREVPVVEGCAAWMRVVGLAGPGARSLVRLRRVRTGDAVSVGVDADRVSRLEVAMPSEGAPLEVTAVSGLGRELRWTLDPQAGAPRRTSQQGRDWTEPVPLPLPAGERSWTVSVLGEGAVRVRQPEIAGLDAEGAARVGEVADVDGSDVLAVDSSDAVNVGPDALDVLRRASTAVAMARTDAERGQALLRRAGALMRSGWLGLAAGDLELVEGLGVDDSGEVSQALSALRERTLYGPNRWRPSSAVWVEVPELPPQPALARRLLDASRGDALVVAQATEGTVAVRWWRRAAHGGQVPTAQQRLDAYWATVALPDHPALDVLHRWSRWEPVRWVRGAPSRRRVEWPRRSKDLRPLFVAPWPAEQTVELSAGWLLRAPSRRSAQHLPIRCLTSTEPRGQGCVFEARDASRRLIARAVVAPWGQTAELVLPPGPAVYVGLRQLRGYTAQVRWADGEVPGALREAWRARGGAALRTDLLGPTLLRVEVLGQARPTVRVDQVEVPVVRDAFGAWIARVDPVGPARISVTLSDDVWVRLSARRARGGGPEPAIDGRFSGMKTPLETEQARTSAPHAPWSALPVAPRRTWVAGVQIGSAELTPAEAVGPAGAPAAMSVMAGLQSRATERLWTETDVRLQARAQGGPLVIAHAGADLRLHRGARLSVWGVGDLRLASGPYVQTTLGAAHLDLRLRAAMPVAYRWTLRGTIAGSTRARTTLDTSLPYAPNRALLWSRYAEDHPSRAKADLSLRGRWGPRWAARGTLRATSNALGDPRLIDLVAADAVLHMSRTDAHLRLRSGLEVRFADEHRARRFTSALFEARAVWARWYGVRNAAQPWSVVRWRPLDRKASAIVGLQWRAGGPRGLSDARPSRVAERHTLEEGYRRNAARLYPAPSSSSSTAVEPEVSHGQR